MVIKKVETIKEAEAAIEFANEQFETDFKKIEPKIYLHDTIGKTFTAFCGESLAGMFSIYEFAYKNLKCMSIGTVCVARQYRNQGVMSGFFEYLKKENYFDNDIATLNGDKSRYEHFGFSKVIESYTYKFSVSKNLSAVKCERAESKDEKLLYDIYRKYNIGVCRLKENFSDVLKTNGNTVLKLHLNDKYSYAVYDEKNAVVLECYGDIDFYEVLNSIGQSYNQTSIYAESPYNCHDSRLAKNAKGYTVKLKTSINVLNIKKFIEQTCVAKNREMRKYHFNVDGKGYRLKIDRGNVCVEETDGLCDKKYKSSEFVYALFNYCEQNDTISEIIRPIIPASFTCLECI